MVLAKNTVQFWLWPMFSLSAMWEEMTKCAKRDALHRAPNKILNLSILLAGLHLLAAKAASVPLLVSSRYAVSQVADRGMIFLLFKYCLLDSFN